MNNAFSRPDDVMMSGGRDVTDDAMMTQTLIYMAVKQYDPQYFSQSGRMDQELALAEGDIVRQLGRLHRLTSTSAAV